MTTHDDVTAAVEAWRAAGGARSQPVAFSIVAALARRAAAQQGEAQQLMLRRVERLMSVHQGDHRAADGAEPAASTSATPDASDTDRATARRAALADLSALVDRLSRAPANAGAVPTPDAPRTASPALRATKPAALNAVTAFKGTWSRLRADQRLRQAVSQVPAMAGPLNSSHVVNRTLQTMRDLSPEYLEAFMAQIDTLMWLERASGGDLPARPAAPREARRPARGAGTKP